MTEGGDLTGPEASLARAVHAVYAAAPEDFVATRKEWVTRLRSEGLRDVAKEVAALRKPSVAAAAVNALVRSDDPVVATLQDVGGRMRHAQSALDMAGMAALRGERDELLDAWLAAARSHAPGGSLTAGVEAEVRDTAVAALADPAATEVVTSGNLTRALSYSGFGEVDVADAVARTSTGVVLTRIEGGRGGDVGDEGAPVQNGAEDEAEVGDEVGDEDEAVDEDEAEGEAGDEDEGEGEDGEEAEDQGEGAAEEPEESGERDRSKAPSRAAAKSRHGATDRAAELEMELDEAEKVVAAARAARKDAARADEEAERDVTVAEEQVAQAERLLSGARKHLEKAQSRRSATEKALAAAEEELRSGRRLRDATRAALEEAEDS